MTTETEKLKKRLELMSKELALHQCKLRRHIRKKEVKLNDKKAKFTQNSSHCTTGTIAKHPCILEIPALEKCNKGLVSSLSKHNLIYSSDSKDEAQGVSVGATLPHSHSIHIASEPKIIQNNVSREEHVCATVVPELASQQYFPVLGEENSSLKQSDITNEDIGPTMSTDCIEAPTYSTYATPRKLISNENDSNWSPILTQKNCVSKSSAKPRTSFIEKRKKCLFSLTKSKKKYIHKQTSFTLNHDMLRKVKNALPLDGLAAPSDITCSESTRATHTDDTLLVREDTVYKKPERNGFVTFPPCVAKSRVLSVIFEDSFLVLVQELQISFWRFFKRKAPCWFHIGVLPRKLLDCGISVGCMSRKVSFGSEQMFVCIELWTSDAEEQTILTCVIYSYNTIERTFKTCCVELKHIQWYMKNVQFCILPEFSVAVSWALCDDALSTKIVKFNIDVESQLILKSTEMVPVMGPVNSLHSLKGCKAVIIGESTSQIYLWNHCTGALVKIIQCLRTDTKLQWADEDQGFLFAAVSTQMHTELIAVNLTTGKQKQVRKYLLPDTHKLIGISVECGKMMAVFLEGFMCWDLVAETGTTQANTQILNGQ